MKPAHAGPVSRASWERRKCLSCGLPNREHGDRDFDIAGMCCREPMPAAADPLTKGTKIIEAALRAFLAARSGLDNAPSARALLDYTDALAKLRAAIDHEVSWDMSAARDGWEARS